MSTTCMIRPGLFDLIAPDHLLDVLDLAAVERAAWPARQAALRATGVPRADEEADAAAAAAKEAEEKAAADAAAAKEAEEKAAKDAAALGDAGKAALAAERKARKDAEKAAREAQAKLKEREDADLSETEKLKKQVEEANGKVSSATEKLRRANLLTALGDAGLVGARAKAAVRLLDVEFDDDDEPTNLKDAIKAATAEYGEDMFKAATAKKKPGGSDAGDGNEDREGPTLTADELAAAKAAGMTPEQYEAFKNPQPDPSAIEKKK